MAAVTDHATRTDLPGIGVLDRLVTSSRLPGVGRPNLVGKVPDSVDRLDMNAVELEALYPAVFNDRRLAQHDTASLHDRVSSVCLRKSGERIILVDRRIWR